MMPDCCGTCRWCFDDGLCHRYPPTVVEQDVSYNLVAHGPRMTESGKPVTSFPIVSEWWVCGEYLQRVVDEPEHAMGYEEYFSRFMHDKHERRMRREAG